MKAIDYAVQANELFVLPDSFLRVQELINDGKASLDEIAEVILLDPILAARILKLANSAIYNHVKEVDTISKALLVLGMNEVYNLVLACSVTDAFKMLSLESEFLDTFWSKSVDTAFLIKFIGKRKKMKNAERLFIIGLLHNLGELLAKQFMPKQYLEYSLAQEAKSTLFNQQKAFGVTFPNLTKELLFLWQLPASIIEPIQQQDGNSSISLPESQLLHFAKSINLNAPSFEDELDQNTLKALAIETELLVEAKHYCELERFAILSILNPNSLMLY